MALRLPPSFLGKAGVLHPAQNDRLTILSAMFRPAGGQSATNKPLTVTSGAIYGPAGTMGELTLVNPTTLRVNPARWVIQGTENDLQGAYEVTNDALADLAVTARHSSQYRRSLACVYVRDSSVAGLAGDDAVLTTLDGALSATTGGAVLPTVLPPNLLALGELFIPPTTDAGAVTLTPYDPHTGMRLGILPVIVDGANRPGHDGDPGAFPGQYRDHPTYGLERWDGAKWAAPVGSAGAWVDVINSQTYGAPLGATFGTVLPSGSFTVTVPAGRMLEVEFVIPNFVLATSTNAVLRLLDSVQGALDGSIFSTNGATGFVYATRVRGFVIGDGQPHTVSMQGWITSGSVTVNAGSSASIPLRYRYRYL